MMTIDNTVEHFSQWGPIGLSLFIIFIITFIVMKKSLIDSKFSDEKDKRGNSTTHSMLQMLVGTIDKNASMTTNMMDRNTELINKLCDKIDNLITISIKQSTSTEAIINQLSFTDNLIRNTVSDIKLDIKEKIVNIDDDIIKVKDKIERHTGYVTQSMDVQNTKIDDMHKYITSIYGSKIPLGEILLSKKYITEEQLKECLEYQEKICKRK
jgi:hypothetical protein